MGPGLQLYLEAVKYLVENAKDSIVYPGLISITKGTQFATIICIAKNGISYDLFFYYDVDGDPRIDVFKNGLLANSYLRMAHLEAYIAKEFPTPGPADTVGPAFKQLAATLSCVANTLKPIAFDLSGVDGALYKQYYKGYSKSVIDLSRMIGTGYIGLCFVMLTKGHDPKEGELLLPSYLLVDFDLHGYSSNICKLAYGFQPLSSPYGGTVMNDKRKVDLTHTLGDYEYFVESHLRDAKLYAVR